MPSVSQQQAKYIWAMQRKYKNKSSAPKNMKWVFDEEWTKDIDFKNLPNKKESVVLKFNEFIKEALSNYENIPNGEYSGFIKGYDIYSDEIDSGFKSYNKGLKNVVPIKCKITCVDGMYKAETKFGNFYNSEEAELFFKAN
jgi:hypothetical protein